MSAKEIVVSWDGEPSTWADYCRKVRLQYVKTPRKKRSLLGPELASRLTHKAWTVTAELDHYKLSKKNGVKYLLMFLKEKLCRTAVPDAGARLEELLIKLRRPLGMGMAQWSALLLDSYRKLQRSLVRARQQTRSSPKETTKAPSKRSESEPHAEPPSPTRLRSTGARTPTSVQHGGEGDGDQDKASSHHPEGGEDGYEQLDQEDPDDGWRDWRAHRQWTDAEWKAWYLDQEEEESSEDDLPWDELEQEAPDVLPPEILGWLLLRRANLSSAARLSVQASVQNSLNFEAIEKALRDQEEELLQGDSLRHQHGRGAKRAYWVEEEGQWGLMTTPEEWQDEPSQEIMWVGAQLPAEVYKPSSSLYEDAEDDGIFWNFEDDGWHGYCQDHFGQWLETDGSGVFWNYEEPFDLSPEQTKELEEAYSAYENKARSFQQSRMFTKAKGMSRGFYPLHMKGKGKGKGKGKKGKFSRPMSSSSTPSSPSKILQAEEVMATTGMGQGCFICGDHGHGFRQCPKRTSNPPSSKGGKGGSLFMVEGLATVYMVEPGARLVSDMAGFGVLDLGATETVGSLEAIEQVLQKRYELTGIQDKVQVLPHGRKMFRFGNGSLQRSESYLLLPQHVGKQDVQLGIFTLMANKVPILIGMKTLARLEVILDVAGGWLVMTAIEPTIKIPLFRNTAGHLVIDLTRDWMAQGRPLHPSDEPQPAESAYMVLPAEDVSCVEEGEGQGLRVHTNHMPFAVEVMSNEVFEQACREQQPLPSFSSSEPSLPFVLTSSAVVSHEEHDCECHHESAVLMSDDHGLHPMASSTQEMRDIILQALASARSWAEHHVARHHQRLPEGRSEVKEEDSGSSKREVRLFSHAADERSRSPSGRSTLLGTPRGGSSRSGIGDRIQQTCDLGRLRGVPPTAELYTSLWCPRLDESRRSPGQGCRATTGEGSSQRAEEQHPPQGQEDCSRRSRRIPAPEARRGAAEEETMAGDSRPKGTVASQGESGHSKEGIHFDLELYDTEDSETRGIGRATRDLGPTRRGCPILGRSGEPGPSMKRQRTKAEFSPSTSAAALAAERISPRIQNFENANGYEACEKGMIDDNDTSSGSENHETSPDPDRVHYTAEDYEVIEDLRDTYEFEVKDLMAAIGLHPERSAPTVIELCCEEDSIISQTVIANGGQAYRCGLHNGFDILTEQGVQKVIHLIEDVHPDLLWVSFPCGPTSSIQELNMLTEEGRKKIQKKVQRSKKLVTNGIRIMETQIEAGGDVVQEWPLGNRAWHFASIRHFWRRREIDGQLHEARVDGCSYGLKVDDGYLKKPWVLRGTTPLIWNMAKRCPWQPMFPAKVVREQECQPSIQKQWPREFGT